MPAPQEFLEAPTATETTVEASEPKPTDERPVAIPLDDVTATVTEVNQAQEAAEGWHERVGTKEAAQLYGDAEDENRKRNFVHDILEARKSNAAKEYTPPPIHEAIRSQTELEMRAGQEAVARHAERAAAHPRPKPPEPTSVSVFRPADYVPDQKKGQGNVSSGSARSQDL